MRRRINTQTVGTPFNKTKSEYYNVKKGVHVSVASMKLFSVQEVMFVRGWHCIFFHLDCEASRNSHNPFHIFIKKRGHFTCQHSDFSFAARQKLRPSRA